MKTVSIIAIIIGSLFITSFCAAQSGSKKETIKVWGNCGMCKKTIEKAAKTAGATSANWNEETKELKVTYASSKTSNNNIQQAIAKAGYDTEGFTASNAAYDKLHGCCKYDRKEEASTAACCNEEHCKKDAAACKETGCCKTTQCCKDKACCQKDNAAAGKACCNNKTNCCEKTTPAAATTVSASCCKDMGNCGTNNCCKS
jgi:periplasmic mercuric ion binding protein